MTSGGLPVVSGRQLIRWLKSLGTLNDILGAVAQAIQQDKSSLIQDLRKF